MISYNKLLANGDRPVAFLPRSYSATAGKNLVVLLPGTGTTWSGVYQRSVLLDLVEEVTDAGHPVVTSDLGVDEFGNARARSGITDAISFAQSVGAKTGPVHLAGYSQGAVNALSWIAANKAQTLSFTGWCPLVDLNRMTTSDDPALRAFVNNAYPPAYIEATHGPTNNPQSMAVAGAYAGVPMTLCYTSDDPLIPVSDVTAFAGAVGSSAKLINLGNGGHSNAVPNLPVSRAALMERLNG